MPAPNGDDGEDPLRRSSSTPGRSKPASTCSDPEGTVRDSSVPYPQPPATHLLFDADDTLWRSNELFEDVYARFESHLHRLGYDPEQTLRVFRSAELRRVNNLGTGHGVFLGTLEATCLELGGDDLARHLSGHITQYQATFEALGSHLYDDTVSALHRLHSVGPIALVTRGNVAEQHAKIALSGLAAYFTRVYVVPDKTPEIYRDVLADLHWSASTTWMVGNSVRHDIHPALRAGLGAIHVDRAPGWILEHADPPEATERCLTVSTLTQVADFLASLPADGNDSNRV